MNLKKNDVLELTVEDMTNLGFGVAKHGGAVIFIQDAVTGDRVRAKIIKAASSYYVAKAIEYISYSDKRCEGRCDIKRCRSCAYKSIRYDDELELKTADIRAAFAKAGLSHITVLPTVASPKTAGYRNKAQYPVRQDKSNEYVIGFFAPKSHNVTEASECPIAHPEFRVILDTLRTLFKKYAIPAYNEDSRTGVIRHIYMRASAMTGRIILTLVINADTLAHSDKIVAEITSKHECVSGIMLNINRESTNVILGEKWVSLYGDDYIVDTLCGVMLKITPQSFYQVNRDVAEGIYRRAAELAELSKDDVLLDLFCGTGSIGLSMAKQVKEVIGIEIVPSAIDCARENAERNGIKNAHFFVGDATETRALLKNAENELNRKIAPTVVVLDPPRAGCDAELISFVTEQNPKRIVYVSCNPQTLARDVKLFSDLGYATDKVEGWDMFPGTGHVETIVCLNKQ